MNLKFAIIYIYLLSFSLVNVRCSEKKKAMLNLKRIKMPFTDKISLSKCFKKENIFGIKKNNYVKIITEEGEIYFYPKNKIGYIRLASNYYLVEIEKGIKVLDDFIKLPITRQKRYSYLNYDEKEKKCLTLILTLPYKDIEITPPPFLKNIFKIFIVIITITAFFSKIVDLFIFILKH